MRILIPLAAHLTPQESRGRVVGGIMGGLLLGILLARPVSSVIADHFGWRAMFVVAAVLMAAISIVLAVNIPKRQPDHSASYGQLLGSLWTLLRQQPVLRQRAFYQACMFATFSLCGRLHKPQQHREQARSHRSNTSSVRASLPRWRFS